MGTPKNTGEVTSRAETLNLKLLDSDVHGSVSIALTSLCVTHSFLLLCSFSQFAIFKICMLRSHGEKLTHKHVRRVERPGGVHLFVCEHLINVGVVHSGTFC